MAHICLSLDSLAASARTSNDNSRAVVTCEGRALTASQLHQSVAALSRALSTNLSVSLGDRVVLLGLNTAEFFVSLLAVLDAGAAACPLNWRWSAAELAAALDSLQPTAVFVDSHCMQLAAEACGILAAAAAAKGTSGQCGVRWALVLLDSTPTPQQQQHAADSWSQLCSSAVSLNDLLQQQQQGPSAASSSAPRQPQPPQHHQRPYHHQHQQLQLLHPCPNQPALIVFTSGTTGASKGVMLSHASLVHQSLAKLAVVRYSSRDVYLHMAPLFHIGGLSSAFAVLMAGGAHVLMPRYSPATALQLIQQYSVTSLIAVPAMMQDLTTAAAAAAGSGSGSGSHTVGAAGAAPGTSPVSSQQQQQQNQTQQLQLPSLQRVLVGAGGMSPRLQSAVAALFPRANLQTAYGMTEASSSITFVSVAQQQQLTAAMAAAAAGGGGGGGGGSVGVCVGQPGPGIAVRIDCAAVDSSSSSGSSGSTPHQHHHHHQEPQQQQLSPVVGEVCTRGPHVMLGYWRDPVATHRVLQNPSNNGDDAGCAWLHTGDLGFVDSSGNLWLVGRLKDMIKTGGENVHAAEVEGVLMSHPAVAAAAVFGIEHTRLGEQVAAAVVLQQGWVWADAAAGAAGGGEASTLSQPGAHHHHHQQQQQQHGVSAADLQQHCRSSQLSPYKLPRVVVCVAQLPTNTSGKVVKATLRQQVQQMLAVAAGSNSGGSSNGNIQLQSVLRSRL